MLNEHAVAREAAGAAKTCAHLLDEGLQVKGAYSVVCRDAEGNIRWVEERDNIVVTLGKNFILDSALAGSGYTAAFYFGLVDGASAPTYNAADTMASHAGWTENTGYSNATRPAVSWNAAAGGAKSSTGTVFNVSAQGTLAGVFLATVSTKGGTTGTLVSEVNFAASRVWYANDTLTVTYTLTLT
ncbi:hypothetical protein [Methylobacterium sp. WL6]|uniref:hypothetical protein n=1 Tax=Methylobacterium sp. WL6 TaxID=2603901 RepID=UPI0011C969BB|nr:hypothetical protein [Methylobacterium sp. WL6]TXN67272.1 hypothetical protein FV230_14515 [Methylobacterium sp. WL6]